MPVMRRVLAYYSLCLGAGKATLFRPKWLRYYQRRG